MTTEFGIINVSVIALGTVIFLKNQDMTIIVGDALEHC